MSLGLERGAIDTLLLSKKLTKEEIFEYEKKAIEIGSTVILISDETEESDQFYSITKGVGAILRFSLE